ncbi:MAG: SDR family oxidoreductase [Halobacteriota archaeon]|nr:SDR family oxidoreductase [Halobacteriota archaeon]
MGLLDGKVAIVTGAGRGIGRGEAMYLAKEGAKVVVNDFGGKWDGTGGEKSPADQVVDEIKAAGGDAVANYGSVSSFEDAKAMVDQAVEAFGRLDIVVNNAGILRDKMIFNMTEEEFDSVIAVHLKGTFNVTRHACSYWREQSKAGNQINGRVINTTSDAGLVGNPGQANYGPAKAGIAAMTIIVARDMKKYGVTANAVCPIARTRLTVDATPKTAGMMPKKTGDFDPVGPEHIAPVVAFCATDAAQKVSEKVFHIMGPRIEIYEGWHPAKGKSISKKGEAWEASDIMEKASDLGLKVKK